MVATFAVLGVGPGTAGAAVTSYATQVKIDDGGPKGASGHLTSMLPKCLQGRQVTLFVVDPTTGDLVEIDATITDARGDWEVVEDLFAGDYIAKVSSKQVKVKGKQRSCRGGRSRPKRL